MDRELIKHLATLYGSGVQVRRADIHLACPMAGAARPDGQPRHKFGRDDKLAFSVKIDPLGPSVVFCFACGAAGSALSVFEEAHAAVSGLDLAVEFLRENDKGGLSQALAKLRVGAVSSPGRRRGLADIDRYAAKCASNGVPIYLLERGIVREDVERWRIGFDPDLSPTAWQGKAGAAVFPVWNEDGALVGAARRTIHPATEPRFFDTPGEWKGTVFYGEHRIDRTLDHVHIVEGVLGTVFASRVLPNAVGMLGALGHIDGERLDKLRRWCRKITLVLDADRAGREAVDGKFDARGNWIPGLRSALRESFVVKVTRLPEQHEGRATKDPADIPGAALLDAVRRAEYL